jgi:putative transposase
MAIWRRQAQPQGLVHHSDRGGHYLSIRSTQRLAEAGAVTSVGSVGDSYDNALAETIIGLDKTELIRRRGPWKGIDQVEYATLEWVDWFNHRRLLEPIGHVPPAEFEAAYHPREDPSRTLGLKHPSLRQTRGGSVKDSPQRTTTDSAIPDLT